MTEGSLNLKKYLQMIEKRKKIVIFTTAVFLFLSAVCVLWKGWPALYSAVCSIRVEKEISYGSFFDRALPKFGDSIETRELIITGYDLIAETAKKLSLVPPSADKDNPELALTVFELRKKISVKRKKDTDILNITVTDTDPGFAQKAANMLAEAYSSYCERQHEKQLDEVIKYIEDELKTAGKKFTDSEDEFNQFSQANKLLSMEQQSGNLLLREKEVEDKIRDDSDKGRLQKLKEDLNEVHEQINSLMKKKFRYDSLKRTAESDRNMVSFLEKKKQEAMIRKAEKPEGVEVVEAAALPSVPINRSHVLVILITGVISGFILGIFIALIAGINGRSVNIPEEIGKITDIKILGIIPEADSYGTVPGITGLKGKINDPDAAARFISMVSHYAPKSLAAEKFRQLKSSIQLTEKDTQAKTIAVTSSSRGEGKSMVSVNLALNFAQAGIRTLLVGSDLRNPVFAKIFDLEDGPGLTDILLGSCPWKDAVKTVTDMVMGKIRMEDVMISPGLDSLDIILSGTLQTNSADLIHSSKFRDFIDDVKKEYEVIIFDSSPVLITADAAILGRYSDTLLLVYNAEAASKDMLKRAISQLEHVGINIKGLILNKVSPDVVSEDSLSDSLPEKPDESERMNGQKEKPIDFAAEPASFTLDITDPEPAAPVPEVKKNIFKILIPVILILLIVFLIIWKKEMLFPSKGVLSEQVTENKTIEKSGPVKTEIKEVKLKEEITEAENTEVPQPKPVVEETPDNIKKEPVNTVEAVETTEAEKFEYQEGRYPYSIYLGSFKTIQRAQKAVDIYSRKGLFSYPVKVDLKEKGIWYRIYSGSYPDKETADNHLAEIKVKDAEIKNTVYACYIGSFRSNAKLRENMELLKEKNFFPYVAADDSNNSYALFAGAFLTENGAAELSEELENAGVLNRVVKR